ncbi:MAG: transcription antitermination factor NusB [Nitrospira sp.]|nr:transcription antitermination factor NusB [Candidatus Manganitrophaceae bacterium]HIL34497.1 transcription antitermination factor NusB [Candidatus Manganitrophaceae bacterium]
MGFRRKSRELALQVLFQDDFCPGQDGPTARVSILKKAVSQVRSFAELLVEGVFLHRDEIDLIIGRYTENWSPERMALIDRCVLRFSTFELLYLEEIPPKVTINEAIEIAKKYGNEDSGAFVNGILDHIHQDLTPLRAGHQKIETSGDAD